MSRKNEISISVTKYVLAGVLVKLLIGAGYAVYIYQTGNKLGNLSSPTNITAVCAGLIWYCRSINRPMLKNEILWFALGTVVADLTLSSLWLIALTLLSCQPLTFEGVDQAVFDGAGIILNYEDQIGFLSLILVASMITFASAVFFAWLMTRKLPYIK